jgi:hypothetical protein
MAQHEFFPPMSLHRRLASRVASAPIITLGVACLLLWACDVSGQGFEVEGRIIATGLDGKLVPRLARTNTFKARVWYDCKWWVRVDNPEPLRDFGDGAFAGAEDYFEASWDGIDLYYLTVFKKEFAERSAQKTMPLGNAVIERGKIPKPDPHHVLEAWFALASTRYLDSAREAKLLPLWPTTTPGARAGDPVEAIWTRDEDQPRLPIRVDFYQPGVTPADLIAGKSAGSGPFDQGYTNAVYTGKDFTKAGPFHVPAKFQLEVFRPDLTDAKRPRLVVTSKVAFECDKIGPIAEETVSFRPKITQPTQVMDRRPDLDETKFPKPNYLITDDWK